jgi:prepilin-type N-terminal cleavage/methylation domain-containing protein
MKHLKRRLKTPGNTDGFTLVELMIVVGIIGILSAIAIPLYANMQRQARIATVQADLRTLAGQVTLFMVHCGDVPQNDRTWTAAVAVPSGPVPCTTAVPRSVRWVAVEVTDASGAPAGPFMQQLPIPPAGWTYEYTPGTTQGAFTLVGTSPADLPSGSITYP